MPAEIEVEMDDDTLHRVQKDQFEGHPNDSMSWDGIERKFHETAGERYDEGKREEIVEAVVQSEDRDVTEVVNPLD
jgi:2-methylcitrate dehydratase